MSEDPTHPSYDSVDITENLGEWFVRVVRKGEAHVTTFEREAYARAFAEGQRIGLNLPAVGERRGTK